MKLWADQMKALEAVAWAEFEQRLMDHWRESFPGRVGGLDDEALRELARAAVAEARQKGLASELDIATYTDLCLAVGTGFAILLPHPRSGPGGG
jgi:hypothetical protein